MQKRMRLDRSFDFRLDAGGGDPDKFSPTLRRYHRLLWSKPLPSGHAFDLNDGVLSTYLHHHSELGEFFLSSDSVIPSFTKWAKMKHIICLIPEEENEAFRNVSYTIGGMMVFPGNKVDGKQTINGARGFNRKISDRFDLTLECIRRHYLGQSSPLADTLSRYHTFFQLFDSFSGYVDFFLLQDLVSEDYSSIKFFMPCNNFANPSVPQNLESYLNYRACSIEFVQARNKRIDRLLNNCGNTPHSS